MVDQSDKRFSCLGPARVKGGALQHAGVSQRPSLGRRQSACCVATGIAVYMYRGRSTHHFATSGIGSLSQCLHLLADLGIDGKELAHAAAGSACTYIPIDAYAFALVEVSLCVAWTNALGVARLDETVEHVRNHI